MTIVFRNDIIYIETISEGDVSMNITIIGRKCNPREDFRTRVEKRLVKVEKLFGEDAVAKVTAIVEKNYQAVEVTVNKGGMIFRAEERAENINDALDECVDSLVRQIRKNKTRLEKKLREVTFEDFNIEEVEEEATDYLANPDSVTNMMYRRHSGNRSTITSMLNNKVRVVKGGSWNDRIYWMQPGTRRYYDQDKSTAWIGFRCAMDRLGSQRLED